MTTKLSPPEYLRKQAREIAYTIKGIRGPYTLPGTEIGIVMDDKLVKISITWEKINATSHAALAEYIFHLMQESRPKGRELQ